MKKSLIFLTLVLVLGLSATFAYAQTPTSNINIEEWQEWFKERMDSKREQIKDAVDDGIITEEEANTWEEHFNYMEEFHKENGFMPGGCNGGRFSRNIENRQKMGFGVGIMRGNGWNR